MYITYIIGASVILEFVYGKVGDSIFNSINKGVSQSYSSRVPYFFFFVDWCGLFCLFPKRQTGWSVRRGFPRTRVHTSDGVEGQKILQQHLHVPWGSCAPLLNLAPHIHASSRQPVPT